MDKQFKLLRATYVLPFREGHRSQVIQDGYVLIEGDKIKEVGQYSPELGQALTQQYGDCLEIHCPTNNPDDPVAMANAVIMPSPKYGHTHFHESSLTGRVKNEDLLKWLDKSVNPHTRWMYDVNEGIRTGQWTDPDHKRIAKELGKSPYEIVFSKTLYDVLRGGSGFVAIHHCNFTKYDSPVDAVVKVLEDAKARAIVFPGAQDRFYQPEFLLDTDPKKAAERVRMQVLKHSDNQWAKVMPGADQIFSNSADLLKALKQVARDCERELGEPTYFHLHSSENEGATQMIVNQFGFTPIQYAALAGILDDRTIVAHQVHTSAADLFWLKKNGVNVISNPTANGSLFSGIAPVAAFIKNDIPVAYSTDGSGSSDHQDIFVAMHVGINMNRGSEREDAKVITDQKALEMILVDPAKIYGLNADSLEPGKDATLIVYDLAPETNPAITPHSADSIIGKLVFCNPTSRNVTDSISMGEWMVRDREVQTMDLEMVMQDIQKLDRIYWEEVYPNLKLNLGTGES